MHGVGMTMVFGPREERGEAKRRESEDSRGTRLIKGDCSEYYLLEFLQGLE